MFAIVPNELLTDDNARSFLPKESHLRRKTAVESVRIDDNITVVCECGESHPIVGLIRKSICSDEGNMCVYIDSSRLYMVLSERGKVLFANRFAVGSDEDVLYYMLAVCEHVGFDVSRTEVMTMSGLPEMVKKYFEIKR